ncbi:MAG: hypothetical protein R2878_05080 [Thermoleophilia bacterium]
MGILAAAVSSSGCVVWRGSIQGQIGVIGLIEYKLDGCVSERNNPLCDGGDSDTFPVPSPGIAGQLMMGFEVDAAAQMADTWPIGTFQVWETTLRRNASYEVELNRLNPPAAGRKWVGYVSDVVTNWQPGVLGSAKFPIDQIALADGSPNNRPLLESVVFGGRLVTVEALADRPVSCDVLAGTVCIDDRYVIGTRGFQGRDLRLLTPAPVTTPPGQTAVIPVVAKFRGTAIPEAIFSLRARTTLPGATATVNVPTLAPPTDSTSEVSVSVPVPANAAPGAYTVTITAEIGATGETRTATGVLNVPGPNGVVPVGGPSDPPASTPLTLRVSAKRGLPAWRVPTKGLPVTVTTSRSTTAIITLQQARRVRAGGRFVSRLVVIARRRAVINAPSGRVVFRSRKLRPGAVRVTVSAEGVQARGRTVLR